MSVLRDYQVDAVAAIRGYLALGDGNPVVESPTGSGKSHISAELGAGWAKEGMRTLILSDRKELLSQTGDKLDKAHPGLAYGYYSASLGRKDPHHPITIAGIQSIYRGAKLFDPPIDRVIVDECDLVPFSTSSMYQSLFTGLRTRNPRLRIVGLTATPFRLDAGPLCAPGTKGNVFDHIVYRVGVTDLIALGHLAVPRTKAVKNEIDESKLRIQQGEFREEDFNLAMGDAHLTNALSEAMTLLKNRHSILIFASGINHATRITDHLRTVGVGGVEMVTGSTATEERDRIVAGFRDGSIRILVNVGVLVRGFDAPNADGIVIMRATMSPALYYQIVGRGFRPHPSKEGGTFTVLDYGANTARHGPIDDLAIGQKPRRGEPSKVKECPSCGEQVALKFKVCPCCGTAFVVKGRGGPELDEEAASLAILGSNGGPIQYEVEHVGYKVTLNAAGSKTLRVSYYLKGRVKQPAMEWICLEHQGYAGNKARDWWRKRSSEQVPGRIEDAYEIANGGWLLEPSKVTVYKERDKQGNLTKYERVLPAGEFRPAKARVRKADTLFAGGDPYGARP